MNHTWMRDRLDCLEGVEYRFVRTHEEFISAFEEQGWDFFLLDHHIPGKLQGDAVCRYLISEGVSPTTISTIGSFIVEGYPEGIYLNTKMRFKYALSDLGITEQPKELWE